MSSFYYALSLFSLKIVRVSCAYSCAYNEEGVSGHPCTCRTRVQNPHHSSTSARKDTHRLCNKRPSFSCPTSSIISLNEFPCWKRKMTIADNICRGSTFNSISRMQKNLFIAKYTRKLIQQVFIISLAIKGHRFFVRLHPHFPWMNLLDGKEKCLLQIIYAETAPSIQLVGCRKTHP